MKRLLLVVLASLSLTLPAFAQRVRTIVTPAPQQSIFRYTTKGADCNNINVTALGNNPNLNGGQDNPLGSASLFSDCSFNFSGNIWPGVTYKFAYLDPVTQAYDIIGPIQLRSYVWMGTQYTKMLWGWSVIDKWTGKQTIVSWDTPVEH
jgi:hypothetical protein